MVARSIFLPVAVASLLSILSPRISQAQVVLDSSVGIQRNPNIGRGTDDRGQAADFLIPANVGAQAPGSPNLFHSFYRFDVPIGTVATFTGPASVENIIARVTGPYSSSIHGTLRSTIPGSNLYFVNPAGVIFGAGAHIDVPGSAYVSTSSEVRLTDGALFEARRDGAIPLLSSAPPAAFGFLSPQIEPRVLRDDTLGAGRNEPVASGTDDLGRPADYLISADLGFQAPGSPNLFHSFREFNLPLYEIATFTGPASVRNIIARVTGGSRSEIRGTLRSTIPGSSLYFLNPAGVFFGRGAALDIPASFYASTANQLRFDDGSLFGTSAGGDVPLLSTGSPPLLGFLDPHAPIEVEGDYFLRLEARQGTIGLIGSNIAIRGGSSIIAENVVLRALAMLGAEDKTGRIEIDGGVSAADGLDVSGAEILLHGGLAAGTATIEGKRIHFEDGGALYFDDDSNLGPFTSRSARIRASEEFTIRGTNYAPSGIYARTFVGARQGNFSVDIAAPSLVIEDGGLITVGAFSLDLIGSPTMPIIPATRLVHIEADRVLIRSGGRIDASTLSNAPGGKIRSPDLPVGQGSVGSS